MSLLFSLFGFAAQVCVICISIALFVDMHSVVSAEHAALVDATFLPQSVVTDVVDDSDATLPITTSHCALSMVSPIYTVTIDESSASPDDFSTLTIRQLKALCKSRGVKGYSSLRKHELVALLSAL